MGPDDEEELPADTHVARSQQRRPCELLGVERYAERWKRIVSTEHGREELRSSAVKHPFCSEEFLLLHKAAMSAPCTGPRRILRRLAVELTEHASKEGSSEEVYFWPKPVHSALTKIQGASIA